MRKTTSATGTKGATGVEKSCKHKKKDKTLVVRVIALITAGVMVMSLAAPLFIQ